MRIGSGAITEAGDMISALHVMKPNTPANPFGKSVKIWRLGREWLRQMSFNWQLQCACAVKVRFYHPQL